MSDKVEVSASAYEQFREEHLPLAEALRSTGASWVPHDRALASRLAEAFEAGIANLAPCPDDDPRWRHAFFVHCERGGPRWLVHGLLDQRLRERPSDAPSSAAVVASRRGADERRRAKQSRGRFA